MGIIKPKKLNIGDKIGVIAPSLSAKEYLRSVNSALKIISGFGFRPVLAKNIYFDYHGSAGTPEQRSKELLNFYSDKKINAIFCVMGGETTNQILNLVNYDVIKDNPKVLVGFSDMTNLLLAVYAKTNQVVFHGPNLSSFPSINNQSIEFLFKMLTNNDIIYPQDIKIIKPGKANGKLVGGNLMIINALRGTNYSPIYQNKILFWEELDESVGSVEYQLYQLKLTGILNEISGMVVGHIEQDSKKKKYTEQLISEITKNLSIPVINVEYFGHNISHFLTIPIGVRAKIDTNQNLYELLESPVK